MVIGTCSRMYSLSSSSPNFTYLGGTRDGSIPERASVASGRWSRWGSSRPPSRRVARTTTSGNGGGASGGRPLRGQARLLPQPDPRQRDRRHRARASSRTSSTRTARRSRRSTSTAAATPSTALLNGSLDATYIGPSPAITAYATSQNVTHHQRRDLGRRLARGAL